MLTSSSSKILFRLSVGEMPDHIEREIGLTPSQQHKIIREDVARMMRESAASMRRMKPFPFNRGLLDFTNFDAGLIKLEAWMKIRKLKRAYDRMNKTQKAKNKGDYARQIDAMLSVLNR